MRLALLAVMGFGLVACGGSSDSSGGGGKAGTGGTATGGTSAGGTGGSSTGGASTGGTSTGGAAGTTSGGAAGTSTGGAAGIAGSGGSVDAGGDAPACTTSPATPSGDSTIIDGGCSGSISYGSFAYGNIGVGRGVLRFDLDASQSSALQTGKIKVMQLTLARSLDCEGDCSGGLAATGTWQVFPLRNDWVEKTAATTYSGADWCRRTDGNPGSLWQTPGADGAADHGASAGSLQIDAATNTAVFDLDPSVFASWVTNDQVSFLVVRVGSTGTFVYATRESAKYAHPALSLEVCP